jgi:hypothetical protein
MNLVPRISPFGCTLPAYRIYRPFSGLLSLLYAKGPTIPAIEM